MNARSPGCYLKWRNYEECTVLELGFGGYERLLGYNMVREEDPFNIFTEAPRCGVTPLVIYFSPNSKSSLTLRLIECDIEIVL